MAGAKSYYLECIEREFSSRVDQNSRYSLRAFSKTVGVAPGALSQILAGKRYFTEKLAVRFFSVFEFSPAQQTKFLKSLAEARRDAGISRPSPYLKRVLAGASYQQEDALVETKDLDQALFKVVSDWYHFAILEMTEISTFRADARWLAKRLQISPAQASLALSRLIDTGMLEKKNGKLQKSAARFSTPDKSKTTPWHRQRQKQILGKAMHSLENDPIELRNHSSLTFAIDVNRIPEAKLAIQKFTWEMSTLLSNKDSDHVYELAIQLFPLQTINEVKK